MSAPGVLLVGATLPSLAASLRDTYDVVELPEDPGARRHLLATRGARVQAAVVSFGERFDETLFAALPNLKIVANFGVGYDNVDVAAARRRGVQVSNTPDVLTASVAEVTVGLVLDVLHRLSAADRFVRAGRWPLDGSFPLTHQLSTCRVGILGLGRIGTEVARRLEPFGCALSYHSRAPVDGVDLAYAASPGDLAADVDVLVVCVPGGAATDGLVDRAILERLGPEGVLVNVSRGSVVDEEALVDLLLEGELAGAGLDVYAEEPHVPEALTALDQVVLLPHVGSATEETREAMGRLVLDNVRGYLERGRLVTPVPESPQP